MYYAQLFFEILFRISVHLLPALSPMFEYFPSHKFYMHFHMYTSKFIMGTHDAVLNFFIVFISSLLRKCQSCWIMTRILVI